MKDQFENAADSPMAPAQICFPISPADGSDLPFATKGVYVGEGGDLTLMSVRTSQPTLFRNVPSGAILDIRVTRVLATGTTASSLVGLA